MFLFPLLKETGKTCIAQAVIKQHIACISPRVLWFQNTFTYLKIYLKFIFVCGMKVIQFDSLACGCPALPNICEKTALSLLYFLLHCRLIDHKSLGLFLGSLSCSIDLCVRFVPILYFFDYCKSIVWNYGRGGYLSFVLLSQDYFSYLVSFCVFRTNFRIICSSSTQKECHWYFRRNWICICKLLGKKSRFNNINSSNPWAQFILCVVFNFSSVSNFLCTGLLLPWLGLFLGILFFF